MLKFYAMELVWLNRLDQKKPMPQRLGIWLCQRVCWALNRRMGSVSFVIPVFNKAKFLKYVIESLKQQSGKFEREFIFIDDGSTDNSYKMILD